MLAAPAALTKFDRVSSTSGHETQGHWPPGTNAFDDAPVRNQLLNALAPHDLAALKPYLRTLHVGHRTAFADAGESWNRVLFPETAVVSLVNTLHDSQGLEFGTVGREGMVGLHLFLGDCGASIKTVAHVPGTVRFMDALDFKQQSEAGGPLHRVMLRYTQGFLTQVAHTAACNGMHLVEERCAGWLLVTRERVGASKFALTHDILALMLGVRHAGAALAMSTLRDRKLIRYGRHRVEIVDVAGLEQAACACHGIVTAQYTRLLAPTA